MGPLSTRSLNAFSLSVSLLFGLRGQSIRRFFVDNMSNDSVGIICNAHLVHADLSPVGALDDKCLQLAKQAALSFDFPKTGIPGRMPPDLRVTKYPDFMEKEEGKETYRSSQILGCLFRVVKRKVTERVEKEGPLVEAPVDRDSCRLWWPSEQQAAAAFDPDLVVEGYEAHLEEAWALKRKWDTENLNFMHYVRTTEGVWLFSLAFFSPCFSPFLKKKITCVCVDMGMAVEYLTWGREGKGRVEDTKGVEPKLEEEES